MWSPWNRPRHTRKPPGADVSVQVCSHWRVLGLKARRESPLIILPRYGPSKNSRKHAPSRTLLARRLPGPLIHAPSRLTDWQTASHSPTRKSNWRSSGRSGVGGREVTSERNYFRFLFASKQGECSCPRPTKEEWSILAAAGANLGNPSLIAGLRVLSTKSLIQEPRHYSPREDFVFCSLHFTAPATIPCFIDFANFWGHRDVSVMWC